jgi:hypothetical protein
MTDSARRTSLSDKEMDLIRSIRDSGLINFDQLGKLVARVTPELFDPGVVADDYIASCYSSVIKVWKTGFGPGLEGIDRLRSVATELTRKG